MLSPRLRDVDEHRFRNPPDDNERYDIVAIGDSHTFGSNVSWMEAWPHALARGTGHTVYNLGVGSYSIYQYGVLLEKA